jgi:acetyl-CoA synthetase
VKWFEGSLTNLSFNCIDRHVAAGNGDRVCFIWEGNDEEDPCSKLTYSEVLVKVSQMANVLKTMGVGKGDFVALYLPMIVELPIAMLACARIGAVHSVMFGGFAAESLCSRIADSRPKVVITADGCLRGKKLVPLKATCDESLILSSAAGYDVPHQLVIRRAGNTVAMTPGRDVWWHDIEHSVSSECAVEWVASEHPLFILYTSGSTGKPKAVLHTSAGYMVYSATTFKYICIRLLMWSRVLGTHPSSGIRLTTRRATCFGALLTVAGSPGIHTSRTGRCSTAPRRSSLKASRRIPHLTAFGTLFRSIASLSSTRPLQSSDLLCQ